MTQLIPQTNQIYRVIDLAPLQDSTRTKYKAAINRALNDGVPLTDPVALASYASTLPVSSQSFLKAALALWGNYLALEAKGQATPDNIKAVLATVYRIEALGEAIKPPQHKGQKHHIWLSQAEVKALLDCCPRSIKGQRDRIILGLLTGAGLRREELAILKFDNIVMQPLAGKFRTVLNVTGKGAKDRAVPINDKLAAALDDWRVVVDGGFIARSIRKGGRLGKSISAVGIYNLVRDYGKLLGKKLEPHDLRRTYAQLGYEAGVSITQISTLLGHASVKTTQRYLNTELDLSTTVSDFVPF